MTKKQHIKQIITQPFFQNICMFLWHVDQYHPYIPIIDFLVDIVKFPCHVIQPCCQMEVCGNFVVLSQNSVAFTFPFIMSRQTFITHTTSRFDISRAIYSAWHIDVAVHNCRLDAQPTTNLYRNIRYPWVDLDSSPPQFLSQYTLRVLLTLLKQTHILSDLVELKYWSRCLSAFQWSFWGQAKNRARYLTLKDLLGRVPTTK